MKRPAIGAALFYLIALVACGAHAAESRTKGIAKEKHNKHAPIEVTSDKLEVHQDENRAIFSGHVVAIQEDMRITSDVMIVYYRKQQEQQGAAKSSSAAGPVPTTPTPTPAPKAKKSSGGEPPQPTQSSIQKIEAAGNVFVTSPKETASGAKGLYDVDGHMLYLDDGVVLTRDKNVLKGDHLTYDLDSGKSVMTAGNTSQDITEGKPKSDKERVHAVFVPQKKSETSTPKTSATPVPTSTATPEPEASPVSAPPPADDATPNTPKPSTSE